MALPVSVRDVINELEFVGDRVAAYLDRRSGEVVIVTEYESSTVEGKRDIGGLPAWEQHADAKAREVRESQDYLQLPDRFDIDEYSIMERFCESLDDRKAGDALAERIRGSSALRSFEDGIYRYKVAHAWFRFREAELHKLVVDWLEAYGIPYTTEATENDSEQTA